MRKSWPASTPSNLVGHLAAWNYFQSIKDKDNDEFIAKWKTFTKNPKRVTNDPMEAHVIGFDMWVKAVEKAKTTDPDKVIDALPGIEAAQPDGRHVEDAGQPPHHQAGVHRRNPSRRPVRRRLEDRRASFPGDAWSPYLEGSKDLVADWVEKKCGNFNSKTGKCGGSLSLTLTRDDIGGAASQDGSPLRTPSFSAQLMRSRR